MNRCSTPLCLLFAALAGCGAPTTPGEPDKANDKGAKRQPGTSVEARREAMARATFAALQSKLDPAVLPSVIEGLKDPDHLVAFSACQAITVLARADGRPSLVGAAPNLAALLEDKQRDRSLRQAACDALRDMGPDAAAAEPALARALKDRENNENIRREAANALSGIKKGSAETLRVLEEASKSDPSENVQRSSEAAAAAIRKGMQDE